jgi:hypothetical protein
MAVLQPRRQLESHRLRTRIGSPGHGGEIEGEAGKTDDVSPGDQNGHHATIASFATMVSLYI